MMINDLLFNPNKLNRYENASCCKDFNGDCEISILGWTSWLVSHLFNEITGVETFLLLPLAFRFHNVTQLFAFTNSNNEKK